MSSETRVFVETLTPRGHWPLRRRLAWLGLWAVLLAWAGIAMLGHA